MKKGEIWLIELPHTNGHEQMGLRPIVIIKETVADIVIVVPFTSNLQALRFPHTLEIKPSKENGLTDMSVALIFQIRAIDKKRLVRKLGELPEKMVERINLMLQRLLDL